MAQPKYDPKAFYRDYQRLPTTAEKSGWQSPESQTENFTALIALTEKHMPLAGASVHDAGCGYGDFIPHLQARGVELAGYVGTDYMSEPLAIARCKYPGYDFRQADLTDPDVVPVADITYAVGLLAFHGPKTGKQMLSNLWSASRRALALSVWWDLPATFFMWREARELQAAVECLGRGASATYLVPPKRTGAEAYVLLLK